MTDLDDLIARLRGLGPTSPASPAEVLGAIDEAAAALEALRDEVERKDAALSRLAERPNNGEDMRALILDRMAIASAAIAPKE